MTQNGISRGWWTAALLVVFLSSATAALAGEEVVPNGATPQASSTPFLGGFLRETSVMYPLRVGEWQAKDEHRYEPQGAGASVRYVRDGATAGWLDLFFYPAGVLSDAEFAQAAQQERDQIRLVRLQAGDPAPKQGALRAFNIGNASDTSGNAVKGYSVDMLETRGSSTFVSVMAVMLDRLYFLKARFSVAEGHASRREARETVEAFMTDVVPNLRIVSSGACWMPLPIDALGADEPAPTEFLSSSSAGDGPPTEFLLADRVVARDPSSAGAQLLMIAGMAGKGRLHPGCPSAEPGTHEAGEGMREIRFEYRAPPEPDDRRPQHTEFG